MSDRLNESDLADVRRKLYVVHARWYDMGLELGLKVPTLDGIDTKHRGDPCQCLRDVLKEWLRGVDPLPTWQAVIQGLKSPTLGHHQLAACIQTELAHRTIRGKFTRLLQNAGRKLQSSVNSKEFYVFVIGLFPPGDCIPDSVDFDETFGAITKNGLWDCINYFSLKYIVKEFASNDTQMSEWVKQYEEALSGYMIHTRISDHIGVVAAYDVSDLNLEQQLEGIQAKYDTRYYRQLSVKVDAKVYEKPMQYITELWESLAFHFVLPSHSVILDSIRDDGILVTWLVPTCDILELVKNAHVDVDFFQEHSIVWARVNSDDYLYNSEEEPPHRARSKREQAISKEILRKDKSDENEESDDKSDETMETVPEIAPPSVSGCGCGKCSIYELCTIGCPRPDHINRVAIWNEEKAYQQVVLQHKTCASLQHKTKEIMGEFAKLVSYTCTSIKQRASLPEVALFLDQLKPLVKVTKSTPSLLAEVMDEIWKAENMEMLFRLITNFWSWYNHFLLEEIIDRFGDSGDQERLQKFREKFAIYSKNRLVDLSAAGGCLKLGVGGGKGQVPLLLKIDEEWDAIPVSQLADIQRNIASILGVKSQLLYLASVRHGCILMTFLVPASLVGWAFPLSPLQKVLFASAKVKQLKCGSYYHRFPLEGNHSQATVQEIKQPASPNPGNTTAVKPNHWDVVQEAVSISSRRRKKPPSQRALFASAEVKVKRLKCGSYHHRFSLAGNLSQHQPDLHRPLATVEPRECPQMSCTAQTESVEDTVHTWSEDLLAISSSKISKFDEPVTKDSWDRNIEPREPLELRMCMGEEWRERLVQERLSQHIAHCPLGANCGDRVCKYFQWFQQHYNQCVQQGCRSCPKYRYWMECHAKNCHYKTACVLPLCQEFKVEELRRLFRLRSQDATEALMLHISHTQDLTESLSPVTHPRNTPPHYSTTCSDFCGRSPLLTEDTIRSRSGVVGVVRQPSVDPYDNPDVTLFCRNTSIGSTGSITLKRQRLISQSDGSMDAMDPENRVGYSAEFAEIVGNQPHTSKNEDKTQTHLQRRGTGDPAKLLLRDGSVSISDSLASILRPKTRDPELDNVSNKSCCYSNNSSLTDCDFCSSIDSMTNPGEDSPALEAERLLSLQDGPLTGDEPQSMSDSASTLVGSESMPSFYSSSATPIDVDQQPQTTPYSPSNGPAMSHVTPLPGPRMSQAQAVTRIDSCLAQNKGRVSVSDNVGKFVQQLPLHSIPKTEDQLEAPYPFLPVGCIPDFDMDCVQGCQLMVSKEFGTREQLYYQQMIAQPLSEDEGVIERSMSHRNSVKQYLQGQFYHHRIYREGEHWERLWKLGSGGQATCFGIADKFSNSLLVLKEEKENVKMLDEDYISLKLACLTINPHPNIVEYFGAAMLPSRPSRIQLFLEIMPACLQNYIYKCGPLSLEMVHHYAYQLFDAVDFLHQKLKIVHCNIKPANLLINHSAQRLKVADFGCAKLLEECHLGPCLHGNENPGTLAYNPPEHYRWKLCSFAFDIWQSGCSVLAMCTGKRPWRHLFMDCIDRSERTQQRKNHYRYLIGQQYFGHMAPAFLSEGLQQVLFGCLHSDYKLRPSAQDCMCLVATSEAYTPSEKEKVLEALGYSHNPQFLRYFQTDFNRLDVYLGVPYHTTIIDGLDHTLQGGWLGWIPYHDGMSYRDACGMITSRIPVSQHFGPFSLNVCENLPQAIWRTLNGYEAGAPFQQVAENTLVDRTKAIIVRPTLRR